MEFNIFQVRSETAEVIAQYAATKGISVNQCIEEIFQEWIQVTVVAFVEHHKESSNRALRNNVITMALPAEKKVG
jgi:hypothetical protein